MFKYFQNDHEKTIRLLLFIPITDYINDRNIDILSELYFLKFGG